MNLYQHESDAVIVLERGEKIIESLTQLAKEHQWHCTHVSGGIGAVEEIDVAYYSLEQKEYIRRVFPSVQELISLNGNTALKDEKPFWHMHLSFSGHDYKTHGGHLFEATVAVTCEIFLKVMPFSIARKMNEEIGLALLDCYSCKLHQS